MVAQTATLGALLAAAAAVAFGLLSGRQPAIAAGAFGVLAAALQTAAVAVVRPALQQSFPRLLKHWGLGMGLRLAGVVILAVTLLLDRGTFPPLPAALGFLGVLVPLLFYEARWLR